MMALVIWYLRKYFAIKRQRLRICSMAFVSFKALEFMVMAVI